MPVKAKRSTYNYSLPITVKKTRECLGLALPRGAGRPSPTPTLGVMAPGFGGRAGASPGGSQAPQALLPGRDGVSGTGAGTPICIPKPGCCSAASQVATMQDLKQGLGPAGSAGLRKPAPNKYKLKVGARGPQAQLPCGGERGGGRAALWPPAGRPRHRPPPRGQPP